MDTGFICKVNDADMELKTRLTLDIMTQLGYDAMTLTGLDFLLGSDFWREVKEAVPFPIVTTNLVNPETGECFGQEYAILERAGKRVAILGVMPENGFVGVPRDSGIRPYEVTPPSEAVGKTLKKIEGQYDVLVLLSQLVSSKTQELIEEYPRFDLAVTKELGLGLGESKKEREATQGYLHAGIKGTRVGYYTMILDDKNQVVGERTDVFDLDSKVQEDPEIITLLDKIYPAQ